MANAKFILSILLVLMFSVPAMGQSRRDLKRMCKNDFKTCKKEHSSKYCRELKKKCRIENGVSFKDDVALFKQKVKEITDKVVGHVSVTMGVDDESQEYLRVSFQSKILANVGDFQYSPERISSFIEIVPGEDEEKKEMGLVVFTKDMEDLDIGTYLQTSEGRFFPKFIDGVKYENLFGIPFTVAGNSNYQLYLDPETKIIGAFIPARFCGEIVKGLNTLKNDKLGKVGQIFPDINSLPVGVKVDGIKVGRVSVLSYDANETNAGIVILFDIDKLRMVAK